MAAPSSRTVGAGNATVHRDRHDRPESQLERNRRQHFLGSGPVRVQVLATPTAVIWFGFPVFFTTPGRFVLNVLEESCGTGMRFAVEVVGGSFTGDPGFTSCFPGTRVTGTVSGTSMRVELLSAPLLDGRRVVVYVFSLTRE